MTAAVMCSIILTVLFTGAVIMRERKVPESISAMVFALPEGGWQWLWTVWLWAVDILTFAPVIGLLEERGVAYLGFATMACLAFVGVWPLFDTEHRKWHYLLAVIGGILSQVCILFICHQLLWVWPAVALLAITSAAGRWRGVWLRMTLISEVVCYATVTTAEMLCR